MLENIGYVEQNKEKEGAFMKDFSGGHVPELDDIT